MNGQDIHNWRIERGLTQTRLAKMLPVSLRTLQNWEQDKYPAPAYLDKALIGVAVVNLIAPRELPKSTEAT